MGGTFTGCTFSWVSDGPGCQMVLCDRWSWVSDGPMCQMVHGPECQMVHGPGCQMVDGLGVTEMSYGHLHTDGP